MEAPEIIGKLSGLLVLISAIPYAWRTAQGKIKPSILGWTLWTIIALSILLNYISVGATDNLWPAFFGFICPLTITILAIWRKRKDSRQLKTNSEFKKSWEKILEYCCITLCLMSLILWWPWHDVPAYSQYVLFLAIGADAAAAMPTVLFVWRNPSEDRPFAWFLFSLGYGLALFSVTEKNLANYSLPIYMFLSSLIIMIPLVIYRVNRKIKLNSWI